MMKKMNKILLMVIVFFLGCVLGVSCQMRHKNVNETTSKQGVTFIRTEEKDTSILGDE